MALRTTAIDILIGRGMSIAEIVRATGLSQRLVYYLRAGRRPPTDAIEALMRLLPDLTFEELFVRVDSTAVQESSTDVEEKEAVA